MISVVKGKGDIITPINLFIKNDIQADGGPHVKNLNEIPKIEIMKMENKGKGNKRIYFKFKD